MRVARKAVARKNRHNRRFQKKGFALYKQRVSNFMQEISKLFK